MREKRVVQESFDRTPRGHRGLVKVGLVLGAGGVIGGAYHAGALTALAHDLGWDPRDADVIVGTSAGSLVGALLRTGVPATDLAAWTVGAPLSAASFMSEEHARAIVGAAFMETGAQLRHGARTEVAELIGKRHAA